MANQQPHMGKAMLEIIKRSNFTVNEVAEAIGVTHRTMYLWFNRTELEPYMVDRVGKAIGVDMRGTRPGVFPANKEIPLKNAYRDDLSDSKMVEYWKNKYNEVYAELAQIKELLSNITGK